MKFLALCFVALGLVTFFGGCATGDNAHYTASQRAAQTGSYDPTDRASVTSY
jgi:hypothetical protein